MQGYTQQKPFDAIKIAKLRKSNKKPSEWIGQTIEGKTVYIVASRYKLFYTVADCMYDACCAIKDQDCGFEQNTEKDSEISSEKMCEILGVKAEVNE